MIGDGAIAMRVSPAALGLRRHARDDRVVHRRIGHEAVLADLVASGFELRLHQRDDVGARGQERRQRRQDVAERDERDVDDDESTGCGTSCGGQRARVDAFEHDDARIVAQLPVELAVADVERDDAAPRRAAAGRR